MRNEVKFVRIAPGQVFLTIAVTEKRRSMGMSRQQSPEIRYAGGTETETRFISAQTDAQDPKPGPALGVIRVPHAHSHHLSGTPLHTVSDIPKKREIAAFFSERGSSVRMGDVKYVQGLALGVWSQRNVGGRRGAVRTGFKTNSSFTILHSTSIRG